MYYSIHWKLFKRYKNIIQVQVTFLDNEGKCQDILKYYEEWIGVCTNNIQSVVHNIKKHFPGHNVLYQEMSQVKKVLPYFEDRLKQNKLNYSSKPFYKVYTTASHLNIGQLFNCHKITYFDPDDWLVRIYIDLCTKYETHSFYYAWYDIKNDSKDLMSALKMIRDCRVEPNWTVAAFDIEAVPLKGNHIPMGYHETDRVVMLSVCKWNHQKQKNYLLYLIPEGCEPLPETKKKHSEKKPEEPKILHFYTEKDMFIKFHKLLENAQILTGYNINAFDFPCIFARLTWLNLKTLLRDYKSFRVGSDIIVTFKDKIVIDLYTFFKTFSGYDLPSFKLDDVARVKLGETKLQVKSTGIWSWYRRPASLIKEWIREEKNVEKCFNALKPDTVSKPEEFATFRKYLDYCLKDSELVFKLFQKEHVLSFLVERANLTALDAVQVLHLGNSRYLLELFKTYGNRLGYFINSNSFRRSLKYDKFFFQGDKTYQGALNFCIPEQTYQDVSIMDFASMYPSSLVSSNLCYGTCTLMTRDEWCQNEVAQRMTTIPYRHHSDYDFLKETTSEKTFSYPAFNSKTDEFAIVINTQSKAFLPEIVKHFIEMRKFHQKEWKKTENIYHYNVQLGIKILINSLYGVMANKDSPLAYLPIAMTIVTLSRYQLLGSYHYIKNLGYHVCYADTDSLMVHRWPEENCDRINFFLNLPHVELKYEQRLQYLLVLSKKRYVYQCFNGQPVTKGFQKKINGIVSFMTQKILENVWYATFQNPEKATPSNGWIVWVEAILEANYRCRDPKKYSIYRKVKNLNEYKSSSCASVKYLKKYPDKVQEHIEFTYSRADVSMKEVSNWIMDVQDVKWVHFEQLFMTQKKIFCLLLNMTFWHLSDPTFMADMVLNTLHWKKFVHAELLHWHATGKKLALLFEPKIKYTFRINDHLTCARRRGPKRKIEL